MAKFKFNCEIDKSNMVYRTGQVIDEFYFTKCFTPESGECIAQTDPLVAIFDQQKLNSLGAGVIQEWFEQLKAGSYDSLEQLRAQCSDADLLQMIKPRCLQSMSELQAWSTYMSNNMDVFKSELATIQKEKVEAAATSVSDTKSSE